MREITLYLIVVLVSMSALGCESDSDPSTSDTTVITSYLRAVEYKKDVSSCVAGDMGESYAAFTVEDQDIVGITQIVYYEHRETGETLRQVVPFSGDSASGYTATVIERGGEGYDPIQIRCGSQLDTMSNSEDEKYDVVSVGLLLFVSVSTADTPPVGVP